MRIKKIISETLTNILAISISIMMLVPLAIIFINSFKESKDAASMSFSLPKVWVFTNYAVVIKRGKLVMAFLNSFTYATISVIICVTLAALAAYALSRNRTKLNQFIYFFIVLGIAMPVNFVSLLKMMQFLNLSDTRVGIILLYTATQLPFTLFLIYSFISKLPRELDEAGIVDGANPLQLFSFIIFPVLKPVLVTAGILVFLNNWNDFIYPLYFLNSTAKWPMTLAVYNFFGMYFKDFNLVSADIILTSLPVIIVYLLGQKYIVSGMASGAVKG